MPGGIGPREIDLQRVLCTLEQLEREGGARGFTVGEADWPLRGIVVKVRAGVIRAFQNWCPHAGHQLNVVPHGFQSRDGSLLLCHSHGALFDKEDGLCIAGPCRGQKLRPVPIEVEAGLVLLAADADPERLRAEIDLSRR